MPLGTGGKGQGHPYRVNSGDTILISRVNSGDTIRMALPSVVGVLGKEIPQGRGRS